MKLLLFNLLMSLIAFACQVVAVNNYGRGLAGVKTFKIPKGLLTSFFFRRLQLRFSFFIHLFLLAFTECTYILARHLCLLFSRRSVCKVQGSDSRCRWRWSSVAYYHRSNFYRQCFSLQKVRQLY